MILKTRRPEIHFLINGSIKLQNLTAMTSNLAALFSFLLYQEK